jgi:small subunit ribosomal protein S6
MRDYEIVYIFQSSLTSEEIEGRLQGYHQKILAGPGSEVTAVEHWGKRQLAYPIDRNDNGYYVVAQFKAEPAVFPEFERVLKLDEALLRHLVVLSEGELPSPPSLGVEEPSAKESHGGDTGDDEARGDDSRLEESDGAEPDSDEFEIGEYEEEEA